jgi:hypothetical protein
MLHCLYCLFLMAIWNLKHFKFLFEGLPSWSYCDQGIRMETDTSVRFGENLHRIYILGFTRTKFRYMFWKVVRLTALFVCMTRNMETQAAP